MRSFHSDPLERTPTITAYRSRLPDGARPQACTINRRLVTFSRYFGWALGEAPSLRPGQAGQARSERARKLRATSTTGRRRRSSPPSCGAARRATAALVITALHTGLRAEELCGLERVHVRINKRSGHLEVYGKRNKHRVVPLNSTAREVLEGYCLGTLPPGSPCLFPSRKGGVGEDGIE